jgi:hypothetical protein
MDRVSIVATEVTAVALIKWLFLRELSEYLGFVGSKRLENGRVK